MYVGTYVRVATREGAPKKAANPAGGSVGCSGCASCVQYQIWKHKHNTDGRRHRRKPEGGAEAMGGRTPRIPPVQALKKFQTWNQFVFQLPRKRKRAKNGKCNSEGNPRSTAPKNGMKRARKLLRENRGGSQIPSTRIGNTLIQSIRVYLPFGCMLNKGENKEELEVCSIQVIFSRYYHLDCKPLIAAFVTFLLQ